MAGTKRKSASPFARQSIRVSILTRLQDLSVAAADNHTQITLRCNSLTSREEQNAQRTLKAFAAQ